MMSGVDELAQSEQVASAVTQPARRSFVPGEPDMWAFVLFESFVFTSYFAVYIFHRTQNSELFLGSQNELSLTVGVVNTLVLLISSWSVARCVKAARASDYAVALRHVWVTGFFGVIFLVVKVVEWRTEIAKGYGLTSNEFFSFYYFMTGIHFVHLLLGFIALGIIVRMLRAPQSNSQKLVETCATYWHTVDYLWVLIFALLYVMR